MKRGLPHDLLFSEAEAPMKVIWLTLLALVLRFVWYDAQPLWTDEVITWEFARATWDGLLFRLLYDASPPGFYLLLKGWLQAVPGDASMRWLPALFGALTVPLTYLLGARLHGKAAGLLAGLLLTLNPLHLVYSNEVRYPTLLVFLLTAQTLAFVAVVRRGRWRDYAAWSLLSAASLWVQYFTLFVLVVEVAYTLVIWRKAGDRLWRLGAAVVAVALLFLPWLTEFGMQLARGKSSREFFSLWQELFLGPTFLLLGGSEWSLPAFFGLTPEQAGYLPLTLLLLAPFAAVLIYGLRQDRTTEPKRLLTALVLGPFILLLIAGLLLPMFRPKYLLPILPPLCVLLGVGLITLEQRRRLVGWVLTAALLVLSAYGIFLGQTDPGLRKEPWDQVSGTLRQEAKEGDVVAVPNDYYSIALTRKLPAGLPVEAIVCRTPYEQQADRSRAFGAVTDLFRRYRRVWYVDHDAYLFDPQGEVPVALAAAGVEITRPSYLQSRHFSMRLFARDATIAEDSYSTAVDLRSGDYTQRQIVEGVIPGPPGFAWMEHQAIVRVTRKNGEDTAFACFYFHAPFFKGRPTTFILTAAGATLRKVTVTESDLVCMTATLPPAAMMHKVVDMSLISDRVFVPNEVLGDGDRSSKSVLLQRIGVTGSQCLEIAP